MNNYIMRIQNLINRFNLDLLWDTCIETSAFIKFNMRTRSLIKDILRYQSEFQNEINDKLWLEAKGGYISICIPKDNVEPYPTNKILESDFYNNYPGILKIALGETPDGAMVIGDLERWVNVLVAGVPGSGKSNLLNVMINCLIKQNPNDIKLLLFDSKKVELKRYNKLPHLLKPVITDPEKTKHELTYLITEMLRRYEKLENSNCRNIQSYRKKGLEMPYLAVIIDELSMLMLSDEKDLIEKQLIKIASLGRASGIHLIIATQKPSADIITTRIKSNIDTRISFRVASHYDSQVILDMSGAEKLGKHGDMLLRDEDGLQRIQCCYISDEEIEKSLEQFVYKETNSFGKILINKSKEEVIQLPQLECVEAEYIEVEGEEENEFNRLYKKAIDYVRDKGECNQWQLRQYLSKGIEFVDKIISQLKRDKIITDHKVGKVYKRRGEINGDHI